MRQSFLGAFLANKSAREILQRPLFFYFLHLDVFFGNIKRLETSFFFALLAVAFVLVEVVAEAVTAGYIL